MQGAPFGNGKGTSALLQAADRLWKAMSYEQNSGFLNSKGEDYFNEFLVWPSSSDVPDACMSCSVYIHKFRHENN